ncbi:MAG: D-amino-acid dehydrogenase [Cellvibrionaceae bacterium]|jgi:D-amino-acid dehydrogenase
MNVIVLGAGVVGVSTAYFLAKKGCRVTIVDRAELPGLGSSYANGGQLSYNYRTPIANPKVLSQLPKILLGFDPAFKIYPSFDIAFYSWGLRYLLSCMPKASNHSAKVMKALGWLAKEKIAEIVAETNIEFDYKLHAGKLYVYYNNAELESVAHSEKKLQIWSRDKIVECIPSFSSNSDIVGGVYDFAEDAADSHKFCVELVNFLLCRYDVTLLSETSVKAVEIKNGRVAKIVTDRGKLIGDQYVLAMGPQSTALAKSVGIKLPIYPMKGYSVTVPASEGLSDLSITDPKTKTVYCKLGKRLRIAGFAEFSGYGTAIKQSRINQLLSNAKKFLPEAGDYTQVIDSWCGLRPATPDSIPIVGQSVYENLYLNVGHGMLGWTHSTATGDIISNMMLKEKSALNTASLSLDRF